MRDNEPLHVEALEPRQMLTVAFTGWGTVTGTPSSWESVSPLVADMNGDGRADIVVGYRQGGVYGLDVFLSNGDSTFTRTAAVFSGTNATLGALGDFDGDGDIDAIIGDTLALNDGTGLLTQQSPDPLLAGIGSFAALDVDGDGRAELATKSGTTLTLLRLEGAAFAALSSLEVDSRLALNGDSSAINLTGDGHPDLVLRTSPTDPFTLLVFVEADVLSAGPQLTGRAVLADATGDGLADLYTFVATGGGTGIYVSPGAGDGTFGSAQLRGTTTGSPDEFRFLTTPDLNGDGIPDLFASYVSFPIRETRAVLSGAMGMYASGTSNADISGSGRFSGASLYGAADFDGDGLLDLWGTSQVLTNTNAFGVTVRRQVAGASITEFTASQEQIRPLDTVTLAATVDRGDLDDGGSPYVSFYIDQDGNGLVSVGDTLIGQVFTPDTDGVYRASYRHLGVVPVGATNLLAVTTFDSTTSPPALAPVTFWTRLYFPEGFRNDETVNEYLSFVNPLDHAVSYEVIARYETGERDQVIASGMIAAFSRGGITICERGMPSVGLTRPGVGYALELRSNGALGATFAHYDSTFDSSASPLASGGAGEALSAAAATRWSYADLSTATFDFLLFYNTTDQDTSVQIRFYDDDHGSVVYDMTIPALRRGGVALRDVAGLLPDRAYAAVVTSGTELSAAHSRYRADSRAWSAAAAEVVDTQLFTGLELQTGATATLSLFNTDSLAVEITLTMAYDVGGPSTRSILVLPRERLTLNPWENAPAGAAIASVRLTDLLGSETGGQQAVLAALSVDNTTRGDIISAGPASESRTVWSFGDAFLARDSAGVNEFESLFVHNVTGAHQTVTVRYLFTDGTFAERELSVNANSPARIALENESLITDHAPNTWYGIMVYAETLVVASLTHWDLAQGGGWSTLGTPQGLPGPL